MKNELAKLFQLAQIDNEIDAFLEDRNDLPLIIEDLENKLKNLQSGVENKKQELKALETEISQKESTFTEQRDFITEREVKVKDIKTIKEYQAALKEVAKSKKDLAELESALGMLKQNHEDGVKLLKEMEETLTEQQASLSQELSGKKEQVSSLSQKIEEKHLLRLEKEKDIGEVMLKKYKQIKARISPAISAASHNGVCTECNMNIPPQLFIELQKFQHIVNCPRCHRILFIEG